MILVVQTGRWPYHTKWMVNPENNFYNYLSKSGNLVTRSHRERTFYNSRREAIAALKKKYSKTRKLIDRRPEQSDRWGIPIRRRILEKYEAEV